MIYFTSLSVQVLPYPLSFRRVKVVYSAQLGCWMGESEIKFWSGQNVSKHVPNNSGAHTASMSMGILGLLLPQGGGTGGGG